MAVIIFHLRPAPLHIRAQGHFMCSPIKVCVAVRCEPSARLSVVTSASGEMSRRVIVVPIPACKHLHEADEQAAAPARSSGACSLPDTGHCRVPLSQFPFACMLLPASLRPRGATQVSISFGVRRRSANVQKRKSARATCHTVLSLYEHSELV